MLSPEQIIHNMALDKEIRRADEEHAAYIAEMDERRRQYMREHPEDPFAHLMYLPIKSKRAVIGIRYVD